MKMVEFLLAFIAIELFFVIGTLRTVTRNQVSIAKCIIDPQRWRVEG